MVKKCIKCNYERKEDDYAPEYECPNCGVIYAKAEAVQQKTITKPIKKKKTPQKPAATPKQAPKTYTSSTKINKQLARLGDIDTWFTKKEIKHLPEVLRGNEIIKGLASGFLDKNTWLIVVTTHRLLFLDKGMLYGLKQMEMQYEQISAVSHKTGLLLGSITISTSGGEKEIKNIAKTDAPRVSSLISTLIRKSRQPVQVAPPVQPAKEQKQAVATDDIISQLERLGDLFTKGILTEDEFKMQKAKLLA